MLKSLRKNTKTIIWMVVIAFVLGGGYSAGSYFKDILFGSNQEMRHAGNVFGKNISFQEFNRFYRAGQMFTPGDKPIDDPEVLRQAAWQGLIYAREAQRRKIEVSDEEVRGEILGLLDRQGISPESYKTWLERGLRETPQEFESQVRELLRIRKWMGLLKESLTNTVVTSDEARQEYFREHPQLSDKKAADEKKFEEEKESYMKTLTERKIQLGLLEKTQEILTRANLQDYQPAPEGR